MARDATDLLGDWQIFFFLGVAGLFFGFFFLLIGLLLAVMGSFSGPGEIMLVLAVLALTPGSVLMWIGLRKRKSFRGLQSLAELLRAYRRIKISRVAQKLGITEFEAESRIAEVVDRGWVKGYIDRTTDEFFTLESLGQVIPQTGCPKCGAPADRIVLVGEQAKCGSCGAFI